MQISATSRLSKYRLVLNFLKECPVFKVTIMVTPLFYILIVIGEVNVIFTFSKMLKAMTSSSVVGDAERSMASKQALYYLFYIVSHYVAMQIMKSVFIFYTCKIYQIVVLYYLMKSMNIDKHTFTRMGSGEIRAVIERKALHICKIIEFVFTKSVYYTIFIVYALAVIYLSFGIWILLFSILNLSLFVLAVSFLIKKRNWYREKYNNAQARSSADRYNILRNYDIIKAYNKEVDDVNSLDSNLNAFARCGTMTNFLNAFSDFCGKFILVFPNGILYYSIIKYKMVSSITNAEGFVAYNSLFCLLKAKVNSFRGVLVKIGQFTVDVESNDTDLLQNDQSNLLNYFNYTDNKVNQRNTFANVQTLEHNSDTFILHNGVKVRVGYDISQALQITRSRHVAESTMVQDNLMYNPNNELRLDSRREFIFTDKIIFNNIMVKANETILYQDVSFSIKKGEKIALVGKNGTGKSTLIDILLRFKEYSGSIFIDGKDMKDIYKFDQRSKISYIPQQPGLISGTVLDNLRYHNSSIPQDTIEDLCRQYGYHETFESFPNGYSTDVGENGGILSGGQKQKISFMRGIIKDGDVFVMDEPTANLDPQSEIQIVDHIFGTMSSKTVIAIIHKHSLLDRFDKIIGIVNRQVKIYTSYLDFAQDSYLF